MSYQSWEVTEGPHGLYPYEDGYEEGLREDVVVKDNMKRIWVERRDVKEKSILFYDSITQHRLCVENRVGLDITLKVDQGIFFALPTQVPLHSTIRVIVDEERVTIYLLSNTQRTLHTHPHKKPYHDQESAKTGKTGSHGKNPSVLTSV